MKQTKNIIIVAFALLFTTVVAGSLWCHFTPEGKVWHKEWKKKKEIARVSQTFELG